MLTNPRSPRRELGPASPIKPETAGHSDHSHHGRSGPWPYVSTGSIMAAPFYRLSPVRYPRIRASNASTQEKGTHQRGRAPAPFGEMILYLPRSWMPACGRGGRRYRAGGRPWPGRRRSGGRGDRASLAGRVLVGEGQRRPRLAEVPGQVAGQHADQHVGFDTFFQPVEDRPQVQVVGFDVPEVPLGVLEVLVGGHHGGAVQLAGRERGAQHVEPVQGGLVVDLVSTWRGLLPCATRCRGNWGRHVRPPSAGDLLPERCPRPGKEQPQTRVP